MKLAPRLIDVHVPRQPAGAVLVLHGGASRRETMMVSPTQLSVLRMVPIARRIARSARPLAVLRLLNSARGWDTVHTPVQDAQWALDQIADRFGAGIRACLVGHSLGGRGALLACPHPIVRSVVALAPWVYPTDVPAGLEPDRRILIVHGSADRVALPERSAALARNLGRVAPVGYVTVQNARHAMLARHRVFSTLASEFAAATLLGRSGNQVIARLAGGESWIVV